MQYQLRKQKAYRTGNQQGVVAITFSMLEASLPTDFMMTLSLQVHS
jgi:hypothetical protein